MKKTRLILISLLSVFCAAIIFATTSFFFNNQNLPTKKNPAPLVQLEKEKIAQPKEIKKERAFVSPYESVNWETVKMYNANFHTHTNLSDGLHSPNDVVAAYIKNDYQILAITDHDNSNDHKTTWPWFEVGVKKENSDKILAVEGNEISEVDNIISLFNDYGGGAESEAEAIQEIKNRNGLAIMAHPGRYTKSLSFYDDLYKNNSNLIGLEVFNQNDRYPSDRNLWDKILDQSFPEKNIFGFANDDMHSIESHLGFNRNIFPLEELNLKNLRAAIESGAFFFWFTASSGIGPDFNIESVSNTGETISLSISGDYNNIKWLIFNPKNQQTEILSSDLSLSIDSLPGGTKFVRFMIEGKAGNLYSQPFKVVDKFN